MNAREIIAVAKLVLKEPGLALDMARVGALKPEYLRMVARGGERFVKAMAGGDVASGEEAMRRFVICVECPCSVYAVAPGGEKRWDWCGIPLVELSQGDLAVDELRRRAGGGDAWAAALLRDGGPSIENVVGPTCGCHLGLKSQVASERCPKGRWEAVAPVRVTVEGGEVEATPKGVQPAFEEGSKAL